MYPIFLEPFPLEVLSTGQDDQTATIPTGIRSGSIRLVFNVAALNIQKKMMFIKQSQNVYTIDKYIKSLLVDS